MKLKRINLTSNAENKALWDLLKGSIAAPVIPSNLANIGNDLRTLKHKPPREDTSPH
jgi:hypothetical protein